MKNTHRIETKSINGKLHAGEFKKNGSLYCAAMVPTVNGWNWSLEKQLTTDKWINDWQKIDAKFTLCRGVLSISW
jgi:hypothetical protein